jgi:hypothetical protein
MLNIRVRNWCVCSGYAWVPDPYAQDTLKFLTRFEGTALCARISTWCVCSVHAPVPDSYARRIHQFLARMLIIYTSVPDTHAQCTHQFLSRMLRVHTMNIWKIGKLMCMLSMHVRNWCIWSGCASVPDPYAQRAHKGRSMRVRNSIFSIIWAPSKREARRFLEKSALPFLWEPFKIRRHLV